MKPTARNSSSILPEAMLEVNMTPLIDVMLVLIIMLIITIPKQNDIIKLQLPSTASTTDKPAVVTLEVDADGTVVWEGIVVKSRAELESRLTAVVTAGNTTSIQLRPHKLVDYKHLASVMASAQRMRVKNMGIVGNEQFI